MNNTKRQRGANFTADEKTFVLTLISEQRHIIENKKTDAVTNKEKQRCWEELTNKFNSCSPSGAMRSVTSLQKFYTNKKKEVRKEVADKKVFMRKTGGGPSSSKCEDPYLQLTLATMDENSVYGLETQYGGDSELFQTIGEEDNEDHENDNVVPIATSSPHIPEAMDEVHKTKKRVFSDTYDQGEENANFKADWGDYKVEHLKKKKSKELQTVINRRRPTITALHSSHLSKTYDELATKKMELVEAQLEGQKHDEERKQVEFLLRKQILELDIEIKKEQLRKLKQDNTEKQ
ncbi:uncharacterized protein LOC135142113 [Zophobas morio]